LAAYRPIFLAVAAIFLAYSYVITYRARLKGGKQGWWWPPTRHEIALWATTVLVLVFASIPSLNLVPLP
jgi:hypothetical protein